MKGAAAVVEKKISTPSNNSMKTIGISQNFFFWRSNAHNSPMKELSLPLLAIFSKPVSVFIVVS
jgi:hypothetical protein